MWVTAVKAVRALAPGQVSGSRACALLQREAGLPSPGRPGPGVEAALACARRPQGWRPGFLLEGQHRSSHPSTYHRPGSEPAPACPGTPLPATTALPPASPAPEDWARQDSRERPSCPSSLPSRHPQQQPQAGSWLLSAVTRPLLCSSPCSTRGRSAWAAGRSCAWGRRPTRSRRAGAGPAWPPSTPATAPATAPARDPRPERRERLRRSRAWRAARGRAAAGPGSLAAPAAQEGPEGLADCGSVHVPTPSASYPPGGAAGTARNKRLSSTCILTAASVGTGRRGRQGVGTAHTWDLPGVCWEDHPYAWH